MIFLILTGLAVQAVAEDNATDPSETIRSALCGRRYTLNCLRFDLISLVEKMGGGAEYQLLPGVYLSHQLNGSKPPDGLVNTLASGNYSKELDTYISSRVNEYLTSLTLSIKVLDSTTVNHARRLSEQILSGLMPLETGRKKGAGGALWAAGSMAAVGLAALAALSGKALMTSMLALMLAGLSAMRSGGGGGGGGGHGCEKTHAAFIEALHGRKLEVDRQFGIESTAPTYRTEVYSPQIYSPRNL